MIFKRILDTLERVERNQAALLESQERLTRKVDRLREEIRGLRDAIDSGDRLQEDAKLQEGISNLMAFDGRAHRGEDIR